MPPPPSTIQLSCNRSFTENKMHQRVENSFTRPKSSTVLNLEIVPYAEVYKQWWDAHLEQKELI